MNKGISKAVREAFINGTHMPKDMLVKLAHLNTDDHRKSYIVNLTKALREKYGMETKRDIRFGKSRKKTGSKPTHKHLVANIKNAVHPNGERSPAQLDIFQHEVMAERPSQVDMTNLQKLLNRSIELGQSVASDVVADAMRKHDMSGVVEIRKRVYEERISDEDRIVEEYVKLDDAYKALQTAYDDMADRNSELKRDIARLQVIITYLEGKK